MIMRANTPRSLTWPGCIAVVVLGLTCLPMLPSLHGQARSKDEAVEKARRLEKEAQRFRDQARNEVEHQKTMLQMNKLKLRQAEVALKAAEAQADSFDEAAMRRHAEVIELEHRDVTKNASGEKTVTHRIEITAPVDASATEVRELIANIQKAIPNKLRGRIRMQFVPVAIEQGANSPNCAPLVVEIPRKSKREQPSIEPIPPGSPGPRSVPKSPPSLQEKRIHDLEMKLDKVLRELHELRQQMKEPHSRNSLGSPPPGGAVPATQAPGLRPDNPFNAPTVPPRSAPVKPPRR